MMQIPCCIKKKPQCPRSITLLELEAQGEAPGPSMPHFRKNQAPLRELLPSDDDGRATCCTKIMDDGQVRRQVFMHACQPLRGVASQARAQLTS